MRVLIGFIILITELWAREQSWERIVIGGLLLMAGSVSESSTIGHAIHALKGKSND